MSPPLVSVCMITWNHRRYIQQAMESVLSQQTPFAIELIVGDDHSTDGTSAIVNEFARQHATNVVVVRGDSNLGMHENAARCFATARGRYIAICEGDDYWHDPYKLRDQVALLEGTPDMTLCHTDFDRLTRYRRQRQRHRHGLLPPSGEAYESLLETWGVMSATAVYRAQLLHDFAGTALDNRRWPFGDYNRLLFAAARGTVGYIDRSTATYRKIRGSAGNQGAAGSLRIQLANQECIEAFMAHYPPSETGRQRARNAAWGRIRRAAFWAGRPDIMAEAAVAEQRSGIAAWAYRCIANTPLILKPIRALRDGLDRYLSALPR